MSKCRQTCEYAKLKTCKVQKKHVNINILLIKVIWIETTAKKWNANKYANQSLTNTGSQLTRKKWLLILFRTLHTFDFTLSHFIHVLSISPEVAIRSADEPMTWSGYKMPNPNLNAIISSSAHCSSRSSSMHPLFRSPKLKRFCQ